MAVADYTRMLAAKCRNMAPRVFDVGSGVPAQIACAGCPVIAECAEFHLQPVSVSWYVEKIAGVCPDSEDDVVFPSWVKAAGIELAGE